MPMPKIPFENSPSTETPIDEENLNLMQDNIEGYIEPLKENVLSDNLFDGNLLSDQAHSSTGIIASVGSSTNENYIPVIAGRSVTFSNNNVLMPCRIYFYKSDMTYLSVENNQYTVTVPAEASYMAFNIATSDLGSNPKIMVNYGTTAMAYQPYANAIQELREYADSKISKTVTNISNVDLNTIVETGYYYVAYPNCTNVPPNSTNGYLTVIAYTNKYCIQTYQAFNSNVKFERRNINGTWTEWTKSDPNVVDLTSKITDYNSAITSKTVEFKRQGNVYFLSAIINKSSDWSTGAVFFKIPVEYIPANSIACEVTGADNTKDKSVTLSVSTGGLVISGDTVTKSTWLRINATWIK